MKKKDPINLPYPTENTVVVLPMPTPDFTFNYSTISSNQYGFQQQNTQYNPYYSPTQSPLNQSPIGQSPITQSPHLSPQKVFDCHHNPEFVFENQVLNLNYLHPNKIVSNEVPKV